MPKRRTLKPESVFARHNLEQWLQDELGVLPQHRHRIWKHYAGDITEVPDIPRVVMNRFDQDFVLTTTKVVEEQSSEHGRKLVIQLQDGYLIETVIIQHTEHRSTVCVSSQVGCQMQCTFCATGTMGKIANLTAAEIVEQVHHARQLDSNVSGCVFMGMGEPLDNLQSVLEAIQSLAEPSVLQGHPIPLRRITLSTVGLVHGIKQLAKTCPQIQLALSLHAPNDEIRQRIVPTTKAFSIPKIMAAIDQYQKAAGRSVMMEYIMIANVNSSIDCAHQLGQLLNGRKCMVNLIPYNPTEAGDRFDFQAPPDHVIQEFAKVLYNYRDDKDKPLRCSIRWSSRRGQDMDAACGQLALKNVHSEDIEDIGGSKVKSRAKARKQNIAKRAVPTKAANSRLLPRYWQAVFAGVVVIGGYCMLLRPKRR